MQDANNLSLNLTSLTKQLKNEQSICESQFDNILDSNTIHLQGKQNRLPDFKKHAFARNYLK